MKAKLDDAPFGTKPPDLGREDAQTVIGGDIELRLSFDQGADVPVPVRNSRR
jgi:hypothetical protein